MSTNPALPRIGFIGLGIMGAPMAAHLARAGYRLVLHDIDEQAASAVAAETQMPSVSTPAAVAADSDIIITMLPTGRHVQEVAFGTNGLASALRPGMLLLDTSSAEPWITQETAQRLAPLGVRMVDAPVSGARWGAEAAELVFMVGGDPADVHRVQPLLERMGRMQFQLGPVGSGHAMKCINNTITAMTFLATCEGLALGKAMGLDPEAMTDVLNVSTGMSWISQTHIRKRITSRQFDDPFKLGLMNKDVGIASELATRAGIPFPLSGAGRELWRAATLARGADSSVSELGRWVELITGVDITPASVNKGSDGAATARMARGTVHIDHDRVRVTEWRFAPGAQTGEHVHEFDYVVVPLLDGDLRIDTPDGQSIRVPLRARVPYFRPAGVHHNVINANAYDFAFMEIELR